MEAVILQPPLYFAPNNLHIWATTFHPSQPILACCLINGEIHFLQYNSEEVTLAVNISTLHRTSARHCIFNEPGNMLASCGEDRRLGFVDAEGRVAHTIKKAHQSGINRVKFANEHILISGDDDGVVKVWDLRSSEPSTIFEANSQTEAITGILYDEANSNVLTSSLDGTIAIYDIKQGPDSERKLYAKSNSIDEELNGIQFMREGKFICCPSSEGSIVLYKRENIASFVARIGDHVGSVDSILKIDEGTILSGSEDGFVRGVSVYPNKVLHIIGQHEEEENFPVQSLAISHCRNIVASTSHDNSIKFYDVSQFVRMRSNNQEEIMQESVEPNQDMREEVEIQQEGDSEAFQSQSESEEVKPKKRKNKISVKGRETQLKKEGQKRFFKDL